MTWIVVIQSFFSFSFRNSKSTTENIHNTHQQGQQVFFSVVMRTSSWPVSGHQPVLWVVVAIVCKMYETLCYLLIRAQMEPSKFLVQFLWVNTWESKRGKGKKQLPTIVKFIIASFWMLGLFFASFWCWVAINSAAALKWTEMWGVQWIC